jgi:hypothetical protein
MATLDELSAQLAALQDTLNTITAQLPGVPGSGGELTADLVLGPYMIRGGVDEQGTPLPVRIQGDVIDLDGSLVKVRNGIFMGSGERNFTASAEIGPDDDGYLVWYEGTDGEGELTLNAAITAGFTIAIACAPGAQNATVMLAAGVTVDGSSSNIPLIDAEGNRRLLVMSYRGSNVWRSLP